MVSSQLHPDPWCSCVVVRVSVITQIQAYYPYQNSSLILGNASQPIYTSSSQVSVVIGNYLYFLAEEPQLPLIKQQ